VEGKWLICHRLYAGPFYPFLFSIGFLASKNSDGHYLPKYLINKFPGIFNKNKPLLFVKIVLLYAFCGPSFPDVILTIKKGAQKHQQP
jgi:hypothetical protein